MYPYEGIQGIESQDKRHIAIAEVLRQIPPLSYKKLIRLVDTFLWYIPHPLLLGKNIPFHASVCPKPDKNGVKERDYAYIIYLSPGIEAVSLGVAKATVAHELAHLCLSHKLMCNNNTYETQEKEAWQLIQKWGFEKEFKLHEQFNKNRSNLTLQFTNRNS